MFIQDLIFDLKDGRRALLRNPVDADVPGYLAYLRQSAGETDFLGRYPEECDRYTLEGETERLARTNASENEMVLFCIVDGAVVGFGRITFETGMKTRHRASVGVALLRAYWNMGIGTRMMRELIRIAEARKDTLQIELEFIEGNERAKRLYEKMGFRITGVRPRAIRLKDGTLLNEYMMMREIER